MDNFLKPLENIKQLEVPPLLFVKLQARIKNQGKHHISQAALWSIAASFLILFSTNVFTILYSKSSTTDAISIAKVYNFIPDNNVYK